MNDKPLLVTGLTELDAFLMAALKLQKVLPGNMQQYRAEVEEFNRTLDALGLKDK